MKRILVLHTLAPEAVSPGRSADEFDLRGSASAIAEALPHAAVAGISGELGEMLETLRAHRPDIVFNLCEAPLGRTDFEPHAAAVLEWMRIPFTGSGSEALALCRRKDRTNAVLAAAGVPVPRAGVFPCVVKPADEDGSAGITHDSLCADEASAERVRARVHGPAIVEEFLPGREFAVSLWGRESADHVSIGETIFLNGLRLNTYVGKWDLESPEWADSPLVYGCEIEASLRQKLAETARAAWLATGIRGYARIDIRLDAEGAPRVLDVNPNPSIEPGVGVHRAAVEAGWSWSEFVHRQLEWARC
jgi:D-alanine-D-alanine ligase